jgi:hypothetical protein
MGLPNELCHATLVVAAALASMTLGAALPAHGQGSPERSMAVADDSARVEWLRQHAATIRTVDPDDNDFTDLAAFGRAIGSARVVFLGEPSHLGADGFDAAFLDFRDIPAGGEWLRGPLVSRPFGNGAMLSPSWPNVLDGLLFVRTGTPATWPER